MLFRSVMLSAGFWVVLLLGVRVGAVPPEDCGQANAASIERAARNAVTWIETNQHRDGLFEYEYNADTNESSTAYNTVRHAGVTWSLYTAAGYFQDKTALASADKAMDWLLQNMQYRHGWGAVAPFQGEAELGASDLMLVALAERRLVTGDTQHDEVMRNLGRFLVAMQRDDGGFYVGYHLGTDEPDKEGESRYYPGESLLGFTLLHEAFPAEGWDAYAWKALDFIATRRDIVENVDYPPLADQWASYGIGEMATWGLPDAYTDYARSLAERFGLLVRSESQRQGSWYGSFVRGHDARGAGVGTWMEAITALWRASKEDARLADLSGPLAERAVCISGIMAARQVTPETAPSYPDPAKAAGAWFVDGVTRMDDQQHTLSGLIYTLKLMADDTQRGPSATLAASQ